MAASTTVAPELLMEYLRNKHMHEPNLFRVHRPVKHIKQLWQRLHTQSGSSAPLAEEKDAHLVAGLLLWRLREEPPFPFARYGDVIATDVSSDSHEALIAALRSLVHELTSEQWRAVKGIVTFLAQLASCAQLNDSSVAALSFVFAPVLSRPPGSAFMSVRHVKDLAQIRKVVHALVEHHKEVFAETNEARPSHAMPTPTLETPSWELSAIDELVRGTVGSLFDRSGPEVPGADVMRWKEAHPSKNGAAKGVCTVSLFCMRSASRSQLAALQVRHRSSSSRGSRPSQLAHASGDAWSRHAALCALRSRGASRFGHSGDMSSHMGLSCAWCSGSRKILYHSTATRRRARIVPRSPRHMCSTANGSGTSATTQRYRSRRFIAEARCAENCTTYSKSSAARSPTAKTSSVR